jgi:hypothetical protein
VPLLLCLGRTKARERRALAAVLVVQTDAVKRLEQILVGGRDAQDRVVVDRLQVGWVTALTLDPWFHRVAIDRADADRDDLRDPQPKRPGDPVQHAASAAVLDGVVKHRRTRLIFIAAILYHLTCDRQQMRQVGGSGCLRAVSARGSIAPARRWYASGR